MSEGKITKQEIQELKRELDQFVSSKRKEGLHVINKGEAKLFSELIKTGLKIVDYGYTENDTWRFRELLTPKR